jgi:hypothetical protein
VPLLRRWPTVAGAIASARRFEETRRASLGCLEVSRRALESGKLNAVLGSIARRCGGSISA